MKIWAVSQENRLAATWRNTLLVLNVKLLPVLKCKYNICLTDRDRDSQSPQAMLSWHPRMFYPLHSRMLDMFRIWKNREVNPNVSQRCPGRPCAIHTGVDQVQSSNFGLGLLVNEINVNWSVSFLPILLQGSSFCQLGSWFQVHSTRTAWAAYWNFLFHSAAAKQSTVSIIQDRKRPAKYVIKHCF